jgi:hypothetical protein
MRIDPKGRPASVKTLSCTREQGPWLLAVDFHGARAGGRFFRREPLVYHLGEEPDLNHRCGGGTGARLKPNGRVLTGRDPAVLPGCAK